MATHVRGKIHISSEDTGSFEALDSNEKLDVESVDAEPNVYGLDAADDSQAALERQHQRERFLFIIAAIIAVLAITRYLTGFPSLGHLRRLLRGNQTAQTQTSQPAKTEEDEGDTAETDQDQAEEAPEQAEQPADDSGQGDLLTMASTLSFNGADLSLPQEELVVEASQGRVQVTHTPSEPAKDGATLAGNAAMRAAALTAAIGDQAIQAADEAEPTPLTEVTWIVRNSAGEAFLAVSFAPGTAPVAGSGTEVLAQAPSYRLSDGVYRGLAGVIAQGTGATPTLLTGEEIVPTAALPQ